MLQLGLSELHRERGECEVADELWQKAEALGQHSIEPIYQYRNRVWLANLKAEQGAFEEALVLLDEAAPIWAEIFLPDFQPLTARKARIWLRQGRLDQALSWAAERRLSADDSLNYVQEFEHVTFARVLLAEFQRVKAPHRIEQAVRLLERLNKAAKAGGRLGSLLEILLLQAVAHDAAGDDALALAAVDEAIGLGKVQRYVRPFLALGKPMLTLLKRLKAENNQSDLYINTLLSAFEPTVAEPSAGGAAAACHRFKRPRDCPPADDFAQHDADSHQKYL